MEMCSCQGVSRPVPIRLRSAVAHQGHPVDRVLFAAADHVGPVELHTRGRAGARAAVDTGPVLTQGHFRRTQFEGERDHIVDGLLLGRCGAAHGVHGAGDTDKAEHGAAVADHAATEVGASARCSDGTSGCA
jgi:hypothetical protein